MSLYHALITEATGEQDKVKVQMIEEIMRHVIFHSTLDWQTREQFFGGAREAQEVITHLDADTLAFYREDAERMVG